MTRWMTWFRFSAFGPGFFPCFPKANPDAVVIVNHVNGAK